ncbi:MAG: hypothetical protein AB7K63_04005 [Vicinamibacterales bacterium]
MPNPDKEDFRTPSQTDSSRERGERKDEPRDLGRPDVPDPDDIGDIADETPGHRG